MSDQPTTVVNVRTDEYDVYIGRKNRRYGLPQSPFANPFVIGRDGTREEVIDKYCNYLFHQPDLLARLSELRGKRLGCWCSPEPCHGDFWPSWRMPPSRPRRSGRMGARGEEATA